MLFLICNLIYGDLMTMKYNSFNIHGNDISIVDKLIYFLPSDIIVYLGLRMRIFKPFKEI